MTGFPGDPFTPNPLPQAGSSSPGGGSWQAIYQADYENVANQSMTTAGGYVLEGATWWAKGPLWTLSTGIAAAVNGAGGGIRLSAGPTTDPADAPSWSAQATFPGRVNFLDFAQFADWDEALPTWVTARFVSPNALSANNAYALIAMLGGMASSNAAIVGAAKTRAQPCLQWFNGLASSQLWTNKGTFVGFVTASAAAGSTAYDDYQLGFMRAIPGAYSFGVRAWGGSLLAPDKDWINTIETVSTTHPLYTVDQEAAGTEEQANMGFAFTLNYPFNGPAAVDVRLNQLAIWQPG